MSFAPFNASVMSTIVNLYIGLPVVVTTGRLGSDSTGALSICTVQQECIYAYYVLFTRDPILQKSTGQFAPECRRNTLSPEFSRSCWLPGGSFTPTPVRDSFYLSLACWLASCPLLVFLTAPPGSSSCPFSSRRSSSSSAISMSSRLSTKSPPSRKTESTNLNVRFRLVCSPSPVVASAGQSAGSSVRS